MPTNRASKGKKKFVCPCGKALSSSSSRSRHRRTHVIYSERRFGCPYEGCKHRSNQRNGLKSHIEHNHTQTGFDQPDVQGSVPMDQKAGAVAVEGNVDHWGIGGPPFLPYPHRPYPSNLVEQFETFAFLPPAAIEAASEQVFEPSSSALSPPFDNAMQYVDLRHAFEMNSSALPMPDYATLGGINYPADVRIGCPSRGDETNQIGHQLANTANISEATWTASDPFTFPDPRYLGSNVRWSHQQWQAQSEASLRSLPFYPSNSHLLFSDAADFVLPSVSDITGFIL